MQGHELDSDLGHSVPQVPYSQMKSRPNSGSYCYILLGLTSHTCPNFSTASREGSHLHSSVALTSQAPASCHAPNSDNVAAGGDNEVTDTSPSNRKQENYLREGLFAEITLPSDSKPNCLHLLLLHQTSYTQLCRRWIICLTVVHPT